MKISEITEWMKTELAPLTLATPDQTIFQLVKNSIRYFNNNSAVKHVEMVNYTGTSKVTVPATMKTVAQVFPMQSAPTLNVQDFPLWTLLGIQVLDGLTTDLIMLSETYKNFMVYMGKDFHWTWVPSEAPSTVNGGGSLFVENLPSGSAKLCVVGSRRLYDTDDITEGYPLDWILRYSKALLRISEGSLLRKAGIIGVANDGDTLVKEGREDLDLLQKELKASGRWLAFVHRG